MALTKEQIEQFKKELLALREQYTKVIKESSEEVRSEGDSPRSQHQADKGTDDFDVTINIEVSSKEQLVIQQIDRALEKIEEGTYGLCDLSGETIPLTRLQAVPYATLTVQAQEKLEKGSS